MTTNPADVVYEFAGFRLEPRRRQLTGPDGNPVGLRSKEFDTLAYLVANAGTPVAKDALMAAVWPGAVVEENNLNQAISKLRQALGDDRHNPTFIATLPGRGYQFIADVNRALVGVPEVRGVRERKPAAALPWLFAAAAIAVIAVIVLRDRDADVAPSTFSLDGAKLVTTSPASNSMPTLSPDGSFMAFVSDASGIPQIWVRGLPDGRPMQLTDGEMPATSPSWSPVDDTILFQRSTPEGGQSIWMTDALRSNPPRLLVEGASSPRFARDGRSFTFVRGVNRIHIGNLDDGATRALEGMPQTPGFADAMPAMNSDGVIAFVLADEGPSGNIWVFDAATAEFRPLTQSSGAFAGVWAKSPTWAADDTTILYSAADDDSGNSHLWQVNTENGEATQLSAGAGGYGEPALSRDGSRLAYSYSRPLWRLVRTDFATGNHAVIFESRTNIVLPAVSADGQSIVYFFDNVYTLPVTGGIPTQLTFAEPGKATLPVWSRSENAIFYYNERSLHRLDPETGATHLVLEDFHWSSQNWLAVHGDRFAYSIRSNPPGQERAIILDLQSGEELELTEQILPTDFSRDGLHLLGRRASDGALLVCTAPVFDCSAVSHNGEPVTGAIPRWSADESRIYYRRAHPDNPGYADIWAVARDGGEPEKLTEIGPYEPQNVFFGVASDDTIIWNQYDSRGRSEIWIVDQQENDL